MKKILLSIALFATNFSFTQENPAQKFAAIISTKDMKEKLTILAGEEMEGRETATTGQKMAASYLEKQFKKIGLLPGNGNSFQQKFPVYRDSLTEFMLSVNGIKYKWDLDFMFPLRNIAIGNFQFNQIVFAGFGIVDVNQSINDYQKLDAKGKLVLIAEGTPPGYIIYNNTARRFVAPTSNAGKIAAAKNVGAAGVLIISSDFPKKNPSSLKSDMYVTLSNNNFIAGQISASVAAELLGVTQNQSISAISTMEMGIYQAALHINLEKKLETLESSNVIGIIPGTDKKEEYVFITSHYDHLGKRGNIIYYGADDGGSGTVGVLQMAEAFAEAAKKGYKPRRTLVFMSVSGEEKGLWGSAYYADHPIFPLDKTSVDLNIDMIGRTDTERKTADSLNYIYVIGHDKLSSELSLINESENTNYTQLTLDYKYDDPKDPNQIYYRSDHYNFAKKGVPILFFYDGMLQADYHKPTDTVEKINFELMQKRAQLVFYTAWTMANRDQMLKRDMPLTTN